MFSESQPISYPGEVLTEDRPSARLCPVGRPLQGPFSKALQEAASATAEWGQEGVWEAYAHISPFNME